MQDVPQACQPLLPFVADPNADWHLFIIRPLPASLVAAAKDTPPGPRAHQARARARRRRSFGRCARRATLPRVADEPDRGYLFN